MSVRSSPGRRPTAWRAALSAFGHITTTSNSLCAAHVLRGSVARGRSADTPQGKKRTDNATREQKHGNHYFSKPVPPTCRGISAVEPRPTAWEGARPVLNHVTTTPSPHCTARVLRERSANTPRRGKRAGRAPQDSNAVILSLRRPCRRHVAALVQSSPGRRHEQERAPRWATSQPPQVRTARHAWSVGGRPILHGAKSAWATRHGFRTRWPQPLEAHSDLSWCWCGQAPTDGVGRSAPRVGPQHNHAKSALRGALAPWAVGRYSAERKARVSRAKILK